MKEVLTQFQIDELLQDIIGGAVDIENQEKADKESKKIKEYNFKTPKKFTKEQLRTIVGVFDIYARHLSSYFTGTLRSLAQVEVVSIEETKFYEYSNALPESVFMGVLELAPLEGNVLMEMSKDLSFTIMDKLLGGAGNPGVVDRDYTDIEISLLERLFKNISFYLKDAWSNITDIEPSFKRFEQNNGTSRIMHFDEIVIITVLDVTIKDVKGKLTVCLPYVWLEPIEDKLSTRYRLTERKSKSINAENNKKKILSQIYESSITLCAKLGTAKVRMRDIVNMEVGDVIKLDQKATDYVKVCVAGKDWFNAKLGYKSRYKAVQIISSTGKQKVQNGEK